MPTGALAKRLLLLTGAGLVVLLLVGFIFGAVGSAMFGTDQFLEKPERLQDVGAVQAATQAHLHHRHLGSAGSEIREGDRRRGLEEARLQLLYHWTQAGSPCSESFLPDQPICDNDTLSHLHQVG